MSTRINLDDLPALAELFRRFNNGMHLNRAADAALWAELETQATAYTELFIALGFDLCIDDRGFAWFHTDTASANISQQSRQLALLFMMLFDVQADAGQALGRFDIWRVDRALLERVQETHGEVLKAEALDVEGLEKLLRSAESLGFTQRQPGYWQLLPAVWRYLDHFQALVTQAADTPEDDGPSATDEIDAANEVDETRDADDGNEAGE